MSSGSSPPDCLLTFDAHATQPKSATKPQRIDLLDGISIVDLAAGQNTTFFIARPPALESELAQADAEKDAPVEATPAVAPASSTEPAGSSKASAGFDISSFGFSFGAPAASGSSTPPASKPAAPKPTTAIIPVISTTVEAQWNNLPRYPDLEEEPMDACQICGREEGVEDPLECEMCQGAFHGACLEVKVQGVPEGEWFCPSCSAQDGPPLPAGVSVSGSSKKRKGDAAGSGNGECYGCEFLLAAELTHFDHVQCLEKRQSSERCKRKRETRDPDVANL